MKLLVDISLSNFNGAHTPIGNMAVYGGSDETDDMCKLRIICQGTFVRVELFSSAFGVAQLPSLIEHIRRSRKYQCVVIMSLVGASTKKNTFTVS